MPVFNSYIATRKASRRQKDSSSAGAAKIPRVGVNKSDLEAQAAQYGWSARQLTFTEVRAMSSSELRWHEIYNATNLEKAIALPGIARERRNIDRQWAAKSLWDDRTQPTPEQSAEIANVLERFKQIYPQFIASRTENQCVLLWLKARHMHVTFENLVESFEANALEGKVWLNPNAINAGSETEVSGTQLTSHHNFHKLILPQKRISDVDRLSADEFLEAHAELKDKRVPPMIAARQGRAQATAEQFQKAKEATATARSGATSVTDYGQEPRGLPPYSEISKASLRSLVRNMSSAALDEKCQNDPSFKKALDSLE